MIYLLVVILSTLMLHFIHEKAFYSMKMVSSLIVLKILLFMVFLLTYLKALEFIAKSFAEFELLQEKKKMIHNMPL